MNLSYARFFQAATGHATHPWQCRLAFGEKGDGDAEPEADWLSRGTPCASRLIDIPAERGGHTPANTSTRAAG